MAYIRRILDDELDELLAGLAAVAIEGPKAVGKTATALQRARTVHQLDDSAQREIARTDPADPTGTKWRKRLPAGGEIALFAVA